MAVADLINYRICPVHLCRGALPRSRAPTAGEIVRGRRRSDHHAVHHQLQLVNLNLTSLDTVRRFSDARHLVILDLHSNFLSDISGLSGCVNLVQLDLHNNQLTELPPTSFWQRFLRLRVLYLHNNAIAGQHGAAVAVESLAGCPKLQVCMPSPADTLRLIHLVGFPGSHQTHSAGSCDA
jgi:hypothetical protein